jgi:hypothetical protein
LILAMAIMVGLQLPAYPYWPGTCRFTCSQTENRYPSFLVRMAEAVVHPLLKEGCKKLYFFHRILFFLQENCARKLHCFKAQLHLREDSCIHVSNFVGTWPGRQLLSRNIIYPSRCFYFHIYARHTA